MSKNTAERANLEDENNYVYQRCLKAYYEAKNIVKGNVLEIFKRPNGGTFFHTASLRGFAAAYRKMADWCKFKTINVLK